MKRIYNVSDFDQKINDQHALTMLIPFDDKEAIGELEEFLVRQGYRDANVMAGACPSIYNHLQINLKKIEERRKLDGWGAPHHGVCDSILFTKWRHHGHEWYQCSVRPYMPGDRCDGTRDDEAFMALVDFLGHVSKDPIWRSYGCPDTINGILERIFAAGDDDNNLAAYIGRIQGAARCLEETGFITGYPFRMGEVCFIPSPDWPFRQIEELLADLYDMNYRSLASAVANWIEDLFARVEINLACSPGMIDLKYGEPEEIEDVDPEGIGLHPAFGKHKKFLADVAAFFRSPSVETWAGIYSRIVPGAGLTMWQIVSGWWDERPHPVKGWQSYPDVDRLRANLNSIKA